MALPVYTYGSDVVFDLQRGQASICDNILEVCGFFGDQSGEVAVGSDERTKGAGMATLQNKLQGHTYRYRYDGGDHLWETARR